MVLHGSAGGTCCAQKPLFGWGVHARLRLPGPGSRLGVVRALLSHMLIKIGLVVMESSLHSWRFAMNLPCIHCENFVFVAICHEPALYSC